MRRRIDYTIEGMQTDFRSTIDDLREKFEELVDPYETEDSDISTRQEWREAILDRVSNVIHELEHQIDELHSVLGDAESLWEEADNYDVE